MTAQYGRRALARAEAERRQLRTIISEVAAVADDLNAASALALRGLDERVAGAAFRVMVVGELKPGKSTLINAMLGASDEVVLIDSPGLREHPAQQEVTLRNLARADAIVFVMDSQQTLSSEEINFMKIYLDAHDVFFVVNTINDIPDDQVAELKKDVADRLRPHRNPARDDRCYVVNPLSAMAEFAEDLIAFLATGRHRAKLTGHARELCREIHLLRQAIPAQRALIEQTEADLSKRYHNAQVPLRLLEIRAQHIRRELGLAQQHLRAAVRAEVLGQLIRLSSQLPDVVQEIAPENGEFADRVHAEVASRFNAWLKHDLQESLEPDVAAMTGRADELFREFMRDLATVREGVTGLDLSADDRLSGPDGEGRLGSAHIMAEIVAASGVALVWMCAPSGFEPLIADMLLADEATRDRISAALSEKIRGDAPRNADKTAASVRRMLSAAADELMSRVDAELKQLRVQVEDALCVLDGGARAVQLRRQQLASWERVLETSGNAAEDLTADAIPRL